MTICVLLSTYNGEKYIKQQIESLLDQSHKNICILVRDDGSSDETISLLSAYPVEIIPGNANIGPAKSFELLLEYALKNTDCTYFMFCDQDDYWERDKISLSLMAIKELEKNNDHRPLLVHSDLAVVGENLELISESFWEYQSINPAKNGFNQLLMQNTATGCTMIFNRCLAETVLPVPNGAIMHDWWIALVASYFGEIRYISKPLVKYRQHTSNAVGAKKNSAINGVRRVLSYEHGFLLYANIKQAQGFLDRYSAVLDTYTASTLASFVDMPYKNFIKKRYTLVRHSLYKQGLLKNIYLFLLV
jgi:glycosyltransferase involved in cell wall biosynthesis